MSTSYPRRWDIFCRVVDNFGDIGVSWRLARQLVSEQGMSVRLWVDHMASLHALCPQVNLEASRQTAAGVEIFQFSNESDFGAPTDVVVEAFGCGLPDNYLRAMAARKTPPLWIVLEYLSAEPWVRGHHGLPSPHPQLNLPRYFFFPGFAEGTGGVLREEDLLNRRDVFAVAGKRAWWSRMGYGDVPAGATPVSLFAYPHAPVTDLLEACAESASAWVVAIAEGPLASRVRARYRYGTGSLELRYLPFVPQSEYDEMLWACDINFVRGEDSFVRAQWAGRPLVWHIYPQARNAHWAKLDAFLNVYTATFPALAAQSVRALWHAWNGMDGAPPFAEAWHGFSSQIQAQRQGIARWAEHLARAGTLAANLVQFCKKMI